MGSTALDSVLAWQPAAMQQIERTTLHNIVRWIADALLLLLAFRSALVLWSAAVACAEGGGQ